MSIFEVIFGLSAGLLSVYVFNHVRKHHKYSNGQYSITGYTTMAMFPIAMFIVSDLLGLRGGFGLLVGLFASFYLLHKSVEHG